MKKFKILFIQTNYPNFLKEFHATHKTSEMNYSETKRLWAEEYFGSSNFYLKNLKKFGWSGNEIIANDTIIQSAWAKEHNIKSNLVENNLLKFIPERIKNLFSLNQPLKNILFSQIRLAKPDVVYIHDITYLSEKDLKKIKRYTKLLVGQIAYPKPLNKKVFKSYDLIISSLPNYVNDFKKCGIKTEYLKWCFEDTILDTIKPSKRIYDITYIGGFSPHHSNGNKILEYASKKIKINFWGYGSNFLPINSNIKKTYQGESWGKNMFEIFSKSKIVINRHINISKEFANNMRMYEATGMGALLVTDNKVNNKDFFDTQKEIVVYNNAEDLVKKLKFYLNNDLVRNKIAKLGQKRTLSQHTYKIRMAELDIILRKYLIQ